MHMRFYDTDRALPPGLLERLLENAILAPTGRNGQPWLWRVHPTAIHLYCDDPDTLTDYRHLGACAGLGAALENFVLAAHHHDIEVIVEPCPEPCKPGWIANLRLRETPSRETEPHILDELYRSIATRCTNRRRATEPHPIDRAGLDQLEAAVATVPGAHIRIHTQQSVIAELAGIFGKAGALQMLDPAFHRELMSEVRWTAHEANERRDGIDLATLELGWSDWLGLHLCKSPAFRGILARCGGERMIARLFAEPIRASAAVALIWMDGSEPIDYLQGGRAMQRAWLRATELGLALYPVSTLPYFFARLIRGKGESMSPTMQAGVLSLRQPYTRHFDVGNGQGEIISFCLSNAARPRVRSLRKPLESVVRVAK